MMYAQGTLSKLTLLGLMLHQATAAPTPAIFKQLDETHPIVETHAKRQLAHTCQTTLTFNSEEKLNERFYASQQDGNIDIASPLAAGLADQVDNTCSGMNTGPDRKMLWYELINDLTSPAVLEVESCGAHGQVETDLIVFTTAPDATCDSIDFTNTGSADVIACNAENPIAETPLTNFGATQCEDYGVPARLKDIELLPNTKYWILVTFTPPAGDTPYQNHLTGRITIPQGNSNGDPHLTFAHGGKADFRGCDGCLFNFLSARDLSLNVKTEASDFTLHGATVHGTFLTEAHIAAYIRPSNTWMNMTYWAKEVGDGNWGWRVINGTCAGHPFFLGPNAAKDCGPFKIVSEYASAQLSTDEWDVRILARPVYNRIEGPKHRLDLSIRPRVAERDLAAWPHGIIGQSFDGDGIALSGKQDEYTGSEVTTSAMAEGAIEGVAADYQVHYPYETRFKYSRFDATMGSSHPRAMAQDRPYAEMAKLPPTTFASSSEVE